MKFKVGQIVELIKNHSMGAGIGSRAKVRELYDTGFIDVEWIWFTKKGCAQASGRYYVGRFKLANQEGTQLLFNFMLEKSGEG